MINPLKICAIGGWSGGHILPIIMLAAALDPERESLFWIGERDSMDEREATKHSIRFFGVRAVKLNRFLSFSLFLQPWYLLCAIYESYAILRSERPDVIFCKGGGVAVAVGLVWALLDIPIFLHESDTRAGLSNRVLGKFARRIFLGFPEATTEFDPVKTRVVGQWINPIFTQYLREYPRDYTLHTERLQVLVQCWGLGSTRIFEALLRALPSLGSIDFTVVLGTRNEHFFEAFSEYPNVTPYKWMDHTDLARAYTQADVALTRASANTLAEAELFGCRIIMVPLPIAAHDHQSINAVAWKAQYPESIVLPEGELNSLGGILLSLTDYRKLGASEVITGALEAVLQELRNLSPQ